MWIIVHKTERISGSLISLVMSSEDASSQVRPEGNVSSEKVQETQDQNEGSGMPSPKEEVLSLPSTVFSVDLDVLVFT
jgi:hypothetical protein